MRVSILIATRNRSEALMASLDCLNRVDVPRELETELIVVDNGSVDDTLLLLRGLRFENAKLRILSFTQGGKAAALNFALTHARGDIIVLCDDDVRPNVDWVRRLTEPLALGRCDAVGGTVRIAAQLLRSWMKPMHLAWLASTHYLDQKTPEAAVGANMAFFKAVLDRVPGFDPELGPGALGLWEDTLFSMQLRKAGYRLGMAPDAIVEHHFDPSRLSRASFLARALSEARSSAYVAWHWSHEHRTHCVPRASHFATRLLVKRAMRWSDWHQPEGISDWEMNLVAGIEFEKSYLRQSKRPRCYSKFGATKLGSQECSRM